MYLQHHWKQNSWKLLCLEKQFHVFASPQCQLRRHLILISSENIMKFSYPLIHRIKNIYLISYNSVWTCEFGLMIWISIPKKLSYTSTQHSQSWWWIKTNISSQVLCLNFVKYKKINTKYVTGKQNHTTNKRRISIHVAKRRGQHYFIKM